MSKAILVSCLTVGALTLGWAVLPTLSGVLADEIAAGTREVVLAESTPLLALAEPTTVSIAQSAVAQAATKERVPNSTGSVRARPWAGYDPAATKERVPNSTGRFDLKKRSAWELKILAALQEETRLEFTDTPLSEVIEFLEDFHGIQIEFDTQALEDESVDATSDSITKDLSGISLRSGLRLLLDDLNLTHIIRDEVLMITSHESAEEFLDTRVYKLKERSPNQLDELIEVIQKSVAPDSWGEVGGPGYIAAFDRALIVSQSQQVHYELNEFFEQLERLHASE